MSLTRSAAAGLLAVLALTAPVAAQGVAAVEALYDRGVADMLAGRYETGCPAIEESHRLDPRPGRLFTLAECEAMRGRLATAFARYGEYLALFHRMPRNQQARQHGRGKIAAAKRDEIAPLVPELTLTLPASAPAGTVVERDGIRLARSALGVPLPTDPGEHVVTTQIPGGPRTEIHVALRRGEKKVVQLEVGPASAAATAPGAPPPDDGGRRAGIYIAGGVGLAGLAVGGIFGGLALANASDAEDNCEDAGGDVAMCNHAGKVAGDRAETFGLVSTLGFGAGLAGAGAAVALLLTSPPAPGPRAGMDRRSPPAARVRVGSVGGSDAVGVSVGGAW